MKKEVNTWPGWECVRQIGEGSFGKVFEIQRKEFGKTYSAALKVITIPQNPSEVDTARSEGMTNEDITDYFHTIVEEIAREFAIMSDLKGHSNIVSYEDHAVIPHEDELGWDILVRMELLTPLLEYEKHHSVSEKTVIKLGCDICEALKICESRDIIHRDIKPENIFVNEYQNFKLGDFGIARTTEKTISNLSKKGTYTYMAPEVYLGKPYGKTVDIYSLGMVLYRFLNCNRTAFLPAEGTIRYGDREDALVRRMQGEPIPEPVNGSVGLKQTVLKALSFNPEDRYQTASEFRMALEKYVDYSDDKPLLESNVGLETAKEDLTQGILEEYSRTQSLVMSDSDSDPEPESDNKYESEPESEAESKSELIDTPKPESKSGQGSSKLPVFAAIAALIVFLIAAASWKIMKPDQSAQNGAVAKETTAHTDSESKTITTEILETETRRTEEILTKEPTSREHQNTITYLEDGEYTVSEYDSQGRVIIGKWYTRTGKYQYTYKAAYSDSDYTMIQMRYTTDENISDARNEYKCDENWHRLSGSHYDSKNQVTYTIEYKRDGEGNLLERVFYNPDGKIRQRSEYDSNGHEVKREHYKKGEKTKEYVFSVDDQGYILKERRYDAKGQLTSGYESEYDQEGKRTSIKWFDKNGSTTYDVKYSPNLQDCQSAVITFYKDDGTVEKQKEVTDLSELE